MLSVFSFKLVLDDTMNKTIPDYNYHLSELINANKGNEIIVSDLGGKSWERACFLGPYQTDSSKVLGFKWDIKQYTDVLSSDGHNVIIFITGNSVYDFIIQSRSEGDFSKLSGLCFQRDERLKVSKTMHVSAI